MATPPRRVSKWEHAFRAGRGDPVELVPHDEHTDEAELERLTAPTPRKPVTPAQVAHADPLIASPALHTIGAPPPPESTVTPPAAPPAPPPAAPVDLTKKK